MAAEKKLFYFYKKILHLQLCLGLNSVVIRGNGNPIIVIVFCKQRWTLVSVWFSIIFFRSHYACTIWTDGMILPITEKNSSTLGRRWASVEDAGPTLTQCWVNHSFAVKPVLNESWAAGRSECSLTQGAGAADLSGTRGEAGTAVTAPIWLAVTGVVVFTVITHVLIPTAEAEKEQQIRATNQHIVKQ